MKSVHEAYPGTAKETVKYHPTDPSPAVSDQTFTVSITVAHDQISLPVAASSESGSTRVGGMRTPSQLHEEASIFTHENTRDPVMELSSL